MSAPQREDVFTQIDELQRRLDRLENASKSRDRLPFINVPGTPSTPTIGGAVFVQGGALHYIGSSGTNTTVAPA